MKSLTTLTGLSCERSGIRFLIWAGVGDPWWPWCLEPWFVLWDMPTLADPGGGVPRCWVYPVASREEWCELLGTADDPPAALTAAAAATWKQEIYFWTKKEQYFLVYKEKPTSPWYSEKKKTWISGEKFVYRDSYLKICVQKGLEAQKVEKHWLRRHFQPIFLFCMHRNLFTWSAMTCDCRIFLRRTNDISSFRSWVWSLRIRAFRSWRASGGSSCK